MPFPMPRPPPMLRLLSRGLLRRGLRMHVFLKYVLHSAGRSSLETISAPTLNYSESLTYRAHRELTQTLHRTRHQIHFLPKYLLRASRQWRSCQTQIRLSHLGNLRSVDANLPTRRKDPDANGILYLVFSGLTLTHIAFCEEAPSPEPRSTASVPVSC